MICEYCGSRFEREGENVIKIEAYQNPIRTVQSKMVVNNEIIAETDGEMLGRYVTESLAHNLAKEVEKYMEVQVEADPVMGRAVAHARVRFVDPKYSFY